MGRAAPGLLLVCTLLACGTSPTVGGSGAETESASASASSPSGGPAGEGGESGDTSGTSAGSASGGDGPDFPPPGPPGGEDCPNLECLPCGNQLACANVAGDAFIGDSCCAEGDAMVYRGQGSASEAVDIEVADGLGLLCGGFGVRINDYRGPANFVHRGAAQDRCQHAAIGPETPDGDRIFWLAHHGDTWVPTPKLGAYTLAPDEDASPVEVEIIEDEDILFEGLHYRDGVLYAATHEGGLRVYQTGTDGRLTFVDAVGGFANATKVESGDGHLYVADGAGGVKILALTDPLAPAHVATIDVVGLARDLAVHDGRLVVALGGDGVATYDVGDPANPVLHGMIDPQGSATGVDLNETIIAISAWSHVAVYDRESLQLLGTERTRPSGEFEQDLGVALDGDTIHVAEWEGHHVVDYVAGLVAPDIWVENEIVAFPGDEPGLKVVVIRNRGYLDLDIEEIATDSTQFQVDTHWIRVPALAGRAFEVSYAPPAGVTGNITMISNDPDEGENPLRVPLSALETDRIDVGDKLTAEFGFLSPTGQVSDLEGKVTVMAYFALF